MALAATLIAPRALPRRRSGIVRLSATEAGERDAWQRPNRLASLYYLQSSAQRDRSKLQRPLTTPASGSGAAAAATNTKWQERTAADVPRACSWSRPKAASPPSQGSAAFVSL